VVRIPLRSAKHHFGVSVSRGTRPYNEDSYQAGVIEIPAFAKRSPISISRAPQSSPLQAYREKQRQEQDGEKADGVTSAESASGDPQIFYFGVYDGHGGAECSDFLRESLHEYIEEAAKDFQLQSSLKAPRKEVGARSMSGDRAHATMREQTEHNTTQPIPSKEKATDGYENSLLTRTENPTVGRDTTTFPPASRPSVPQKANRGRVVELEESLIKGWKSLVGGYFKRFQPDLFSRSKMDAVDVSTVLTYAFLRADFEFVRAQARKTDQDEDAVVTDAPLNATDVLGTSSVGGPKRFKGGSTCSLALISTPSPTPFWHPSTSSTLVVAHVGDTRIILCKTGDGTALPVTTNHHPSNPVEAQRLRKYAGAFVTDSFGEERMSGLANTRAFGDMQSKRLGVSAEPEIRRLEMGPAQYSFMVLVSDGISGTLSDQEVVDIVKEAKTPENGARDVVSFATEVSTEGDNATCLVVRMGGWERRSEGGVGSLGTREAREYRRQESLDPRSRRN
jgi:protein phosphatase PTC6